MSEEIAIELKNIGKQYKLGVIGGSTLSEDVKRWWARKTGKEDPMAKIGENANFENYGESFWALQNINLTIKKGEAVGIIGHNGAGKSTLLKLLSRVTCPTTGEAVLNGRVASMLEVGTGFHPELTGRENIYMNGAILGMTKAEVDSKIEQIIDFSECRQFIDTPVKRYSSGMYVKLAFAVAAHLDSEIMIMDEVLAVGDMKFQQKCLGKMENSANVDGKTVLYVSHNMNTIRQLCSRCIVLEKGQVIFDGDVEKAIEIYIGAVGVSDNVVDLKSMKRADEFSMNKATMTQLELTDGKNGHYYTGDRMECTLTIESANYIPRYYTRVIIKHANGDPVTMMMTNGDMCINEGDNKRRLTIDISELAPGKYTLSFVLFELNEFGTNGFLDGLHTIYTFTISPQASLNDGLEWKSKYWGYTIGKNIVEQEVH